MRAILFDLDGVLVDTEHCHRKALAQAALETFPSFPPDFFKPLLKFDGRSTAQKLQSMHAVIDSLLRQTFPDGLDMGCAEYIQHVDIRKQELVGPMLDRIHPDFMISLMLRHLSRIEGYRLGLVSNTRRKNMFQIVERMEISEYFELRYAGDDGLDRKPDPAMYLHMMEQMQVSPTDTLIVEDSSHGRLAAKRSGAYLYEVTDRTDLDLEQLHNGILEADRCRTDGWPGLTVRRAGLRADQTPH